MDDLRTLRAWRAEVPEPGPEWVVPERRRLLTRMRERRRTLGRRLLVVGALGTAAALAVVVLRPQPQAEVPGVVSTAPIVRLDSGVVLARAAEVAGGRESAQVPLPTQWHYTRTLDKQPNADTTKTVEQWLRYDGRQAASYDENGDLSVGPEGDPRDPGDDDLSPQQYDAKLRALPTDPVKLLAKITADPHWIRGAREKGVPHRVPPAAIRGYHVIMLYLSRYGSMPPRLESAMFRALALIPGVRIEQGVRDAAGRAGLGVWLETDEDRPSRRYTVLDPVTYRYWGTRTVWLRDEFLGRKDVPALPKGSVWSTALVASTIVDRPGDRG
ncbi:CU044_5270 family protein [Nonomuraea sp. NPDC050328]|uniref:CU044_5270 family protein n=1 Tax=Nonomuraea sp. NPDC050328 TaxID=3364361 RepID=UPI0037A1B746